LKLSDRYPHFKFQTGKHLTLLILNTLLITFLWNNPTLFAAKKAYPFSPGEQLTFEVRWSFIPAGRAVLEILPVEEVNGENAFHFVMTSETYPLIDIFYKVRDRIDSYTDTCMTHSFKYKKSKRGTSTKEVEVIFNWKKGTARYSESGQKGQEISIMPGSFDPLSVFYAFRLHSLYQGKKIETPVTDGKKCVIGKATVIKKEKIKINGKLYDTYLVEPELKHLGGVFEKTEDAKLRIWVSADDKKIPLRIESRLIVGSFIAELTSYKKAAP